MIKTYSELCRFKTFEERYNYLKLSNSIGVPTFGFDRYLNQAFYTSPEWKHVRNEVIIRDNGCDLGIEGFEIHSKIIVHHMNPISEFDIEKRLNDILNPEFLICVSHKTHNAIHFSNDDLIPKLVITERKPNDMIPWR